MTRFHSIRFLAAVSILAFLILISRHGSAEPAQEKKGEKEIGSSAQAVPPQGLQVNPPLPGDPPAAALNPFGRRISVPEFPKDMTWINSAPLKKRDLRGKFVILDFWTYCCINCLHILPELKKLEQKYPNQLVVIGVHSAKFDTEKGTKNIEEAVLRHEIKHPVVNDDKHLIWDTYGVRSWPTVLMIDPQGQAIWGKSGEVKAAEIEEVLKVGIPYYRQIGALDERPIRFPLLTHRRKNTPLRFPGKIMADETGKRLFITDSNHNRIVVTDLEGNLQQTIGSGAIGRKDGNFQTASFDHPQGVALNGNTLYVADTENHMLRKVNLNTKTVTTIAGTGEQGRNPWPGFDFTKPTGKQRLVAVPKTYALNSPWALWVQGKSLFIAMAGPHQIWRMSLDEKEIGPYAGNGREDIVDGGLLPDQPYSQNNGVDLAYSSFAQPSGLTSDGSWLFVADSEGSSIRAVPFDTTKLVRTVVGTSRLPYNRLFSFGDVDGPKDKVKLQHALGVAYHQGTIYVADTYNNKIKAVNAKTGQTRTLAGTGKPGASDSAGTFDEPAGIAVMRGTIYVADTNNHLIRTVDSKTGKVATLAIKGLKPPPRKKSSSVPNFAKARQVTLPVQRVRALDGKVRMTVELRLPNGWKLNPQVPMTYYTMAKGKGIIDRSRLGRNQLSKVQPSFEVVLNVNGTGKDTAQVGMTYFFCQKDDSGLCKIGSVLFTVPLEVGENGRTSAIKASHEIQP